MEIVDLFDNKRSFLNKTIERYHYIPETYFQVIHLWIKNSKGNYLIQKRSLTKETNPGIWSITGGVVDSGELPINAAYRECKEELGIDIKPEEIQFMLSIKRPKMFVDVYLIERDIDLADIVMQESEVADVKWFTTEEIIKMAKNREMGGSISIYYDTFFNLINQSDNQ